MSEAAHPAPDEAPPGSPDAGRVAVAKRRGFRPLLVLLQRMLGDRAEVGGAAAPSEEGIRFHHDPALAFSTSDVAKVERRAAPPDPSDFTSAPREVWHITTSFLGLTGAVSPLPHHIGEEVAQEDPDSPRQRDFLDLFHHRLLSLFQRAVARGDFPDGYRSDQTDGWSRRLLSFLGFDAVEGPPPSKLPSWRLLRFAPLLAEPAMTAHALEVALGDVLAAELGDASLEVEQFVGTWAEVAPPQWTRLGRINAALGRDLLVGRRIFDRAGKFRIRVGPLGREGYERFALSPEPLEEMRRVVETLSPEPLEYDVELVLAPEAAPGLRLGASGLHRLGRNAWLGGQRHGARVRLSSAWGRREAAGGSAP